LLSKLLCEVIISVIVVPVILPQLAVLGILSEILFPVSSLKFLGMLRRMQVSKSKLSILSLGVIKQTNGFENRRPQDSAMQEQSVVRELHPAF
jgi:hypothetical protein